MEASKQEQQSEDRSGAELIEAVADKKKLSSKETVDALDWFLADDDGDFTHELRLNVGTRDKERWISWEIQPVDLDTLKKIRRLAQAGSRAQRRSGNPGELDEVEANLRIVLEGTASPDLKAIAAQMDYKDPAEVLKYRFRHKPGLIGQISGEIMSISGYDDDDIKDVEAAGN